MYSSDNARYRVIFIIQPRRSLTPYTWIFIDRLKSNWHESTIDRTLFIINHPCKPKHLSNSRPQNLAYSADSYDLSQNNTFIVLMTTQFSHQISPCSIFLTIGWRPLTNRARTANALIYREKCFLPTEIINIGIEHRKNEDNFNTIDGRYRSPFLTCRDMSWKYRHEMLRKTYISQRRSSDQSRYIEKYLTGL